MVPQKGNKRVLIIVVITLLMTTPVIADTGREIDQILAQVQTGLMMAQKEVHGKSLPKLETVTLILETEFKYGTGGKLNLFVISFGQRVENTKAQKLTLKLEPPKPPFKEPIAAEDEGKLSKELANAIVVAAQGVSNAQNREPPLKLAKLDAELHFIIKQEAEGSGKFELLPVSVEFKGDIKETALQTIKISFGL